jgi:hypothetical protein
MIYHDEVEVAAVVIVVDASSVGMIEGAAGHWL